MQEFPLVHVFGFTGYGPDTAIGRKVKFLNEFYPDRFSVRFSGIDTEVRKQDQQPDGIPCPAQTGKTECCATCALCWQSSDKISFLEH